MAAEAEIWPPLPSTVRPEPDGARLRPAEVQVSV